MVFFAIPPFPRLAAVVIAALGTFYLTSEAGRTLRVRAILSPFLGNSGTVLGCSAVLMPRVRTFLYLPAPIFEEEFERVFLRHFYMVNPVKKYIFFKFIKP